MIYICLFGRIGNQLFEYALAREIQRQTGQKICVNSVLLQKYRPNFANSLKDYVLNDNVIFEDKKPLPWYVDTHFFPIRVIKKVFPKTFLKFSEKQGRFIWLKDTYVNLPILPLKKDYYLVGYWQCPKYFHNVEDIIREEFTPKEPLLKCNEQLYYEIQNSESVCVTIRRGDYVSNEKFKKRFFLCDTSYFLKGIDIIRSKIPNATIVCFSDDIEWVKQNVPISGRVLYESGKDPVWEKLRLMSACKHFVISNSSFSWWAQHLSDNSNKIVVAPSRWYTDENGICDIYEDGWELLNV